MCLSSICELDTSLFQLTVGTMDAGYRFIGCSKYNAKTIKDPKEMRVGIEKDGVNNTDTHPNTLSWIDTCTTKSYGKAPYLTLF